jgi:hypothetical protein
VRAAAIGITCSAILAFCGVLASTAAARDDLDPIGTVTSVVSPVTSVASDLVGQAPAVSGGSGGGGGTADSAGSAVGSVQTAVSGATGASSSSSTSTGGSTSTADSSQSRQSSAERRARARGSAHTRFDRLPRRYEVLLERIEFGLKLRASIARLRVLFASASPELQLRILRLLRAEIRRLERGGLTNGERGRARRLRHLLSDLAGSPSGSTPMSSVTVALQSLAGAEIASAAGGLLATPPNGAGSPPGTTDRPFTGGPMGGVPDIPEVSPPPRAPPVDGTVWLWIVLAILWAIAFVVVLDELGVRLAKNRT